MSQAKDLLRLRKSRLVVLNSEQLSLVAGGGADGVLGLTQRECGMTRDTCNDYTDATCDYTILQCAPPTDTGTQATLRKDECRFGTA